MIFKEENVSFIIKKSFTNIADSLEITADYFEGIHISYKRIIVLKEENILLII